MFPRYLIRLLGRVAIFGFFAWVYVAHRVWLYQIFEFRLFGPLGWTHLLWAVLMGGMVLHLLPRGPITLGGRKQFAAHYREPAHLPERAVLLEYVQQQNIRAWRVMLVWLIVHVGVALLYLAGIINPAELFMLSMLYFVGDLVCVLILCPFQIFGMKNRCCISCRIFDWGHFFMYTPMLFIKSFFSWSLFFMACAILIRWEIAYARHPERFWEGSNEAIHCENCAERICRVKKPLTRKLFPHYRRQP